MIMIQSLKQVAASGKGIQHCISISTDDVIETTLAMAASVKSLETFVCKMYAPKISTRILSELRWELFRANNLESEMLPPLVDTLIPRVQGVNYYCYAS